MEEYIDFLLSVGRVGEAASRLAQLLNREAFVSPRGETRHTTWLRLCRLLSEHPAEVSGKLRAEAIIRGGLREFSDEVGHIWVSLADFFIRQAQFERARDVYEEAVTTVMTVRDFSMVFDAYAQYEESIIAAAMEQLPALEAEAAAEGAGGEAAGRLAEAQADLDIRLARLERLTERRPELLSSVLLRQNPHSVKEWLRRVGLFKADPARCIHTYATAVKTVSPEHATHGKLSSLWIAFAGFYEKHGDVKNARAILRKAADVQFKTADELASIWLERAELELRCKAYPAALELLREATLPPPPSERSKKALESGPVRNSLYRVTRLWALYADLEESVGTVESVKACYEKMFALKVITPQLVLSLAAFLEEKGFFEQSFQAYERGVAAFSHPWSLELWRAYLAKFTARYGGSKLERTRDLFEQAVEKTPPEASAEFWRAYALFELEHGLARHAMAVFARACEAVAAPFKAELFRLHIAKASETFGVAKTRPIYERAIEALPDEGARLLCLEYAQLETKLGEVRRRAACALLRPMLRARMPCGCRRPRGKGTPLTPAAACVPSHRLAAAARAQAERARALYVHAAQMYDPKTEAKTWQEWNDFEVEHGNEDSFREMLRIKRAVKVQYAAVGAATVTDPAARGGGAGAGTGAAVGVAADGYIPSDSWRGIQRGYVFKKGPLGLGYYRDELAAHSQPLDLGNGDGAAAPPPPPPAAAAAAALEPDVEEPAPPARHAVQSEEEADAGTLAPRLALCPRTLPRIFVQRVHRLTANACAAHVLTRAAHRRGEHQAKARARRGLRLGDWAWREARRG